MWKAIQLDVEFPDTAAPPIEADSHVMSVCLKADRDPWECIKT